MDGDCASGEREPLTGGGDGEDGGTGEGEVAEAVGGRTQETVLDIEVLKENVSVSESSGTGREGRNEMGETERREGQDAAAVGGAEGAADEAGKGVSVGEASGTTGAQQSETPPKADPSQTAPTAAAGAAAAAAAAGSAPAGARAGARRTTVDGGRTWGGGIRANTTPYWRFVQILSAVGAGVIFIPALVFTVIIFVRSLCLQAWYRLCYSGAVRRRNRRVVTPSCLSVLPSPCMRGTLDLEQRLEVVSWEDGRVVTWRKSDEAARGSNGATGAAAAAAAGAAGVAAAAAGSVGDGDGGTTTGASAGDAGTSSSEGGKGEVCIDVGGSSGAESAGALASGRGGASAGGAGGEEGGGDNSVAGIEIRPASPMASVAENSYQRGIPRRLSLSFVHAWTFTYTHVVNRTAVMNEDTLLELVRRRPKGTPLITVSNHMSTCVRGWGWMGSHGVAWDLLAPAASPSTRGFS
ncbi:unnamed protein product [Closterium sp. Yama58-4]|nr:unnamed protein product [Closterium sp. Yama58-4]